MKGRSPKRDGSEHPLKQALRLRGITHHVVALALGVSQPAVTQWLNNPRLRLDTEVKIQALLEGREL
jgi:predicted transcriptional regulator